jgi:hypothetical protein
MPQENARTGRGPSEPPVMINESGMRSIKESFYEVTLAGAQLRSAPAPAPKSPVPAPAPVPAEVDQSGFLLDGKPLVPRAAPAAPRSPSR